MDKIIHGINQINISSTPASLTIAGHMLNAFYLALILKKLSGEIITLDEKEKTIDQVRSLYIDFVQWSEGVLKNGRFSSPQESDQPKDTHK